MSYQDTDYVLPVWLLEKRAGHDVCLVTLISVEGSSPRPIGSQIIVSTSGLCVGYITGGCAEAAIKAEALDVIQSGQPRTVRYGEGSPYKDIILPCGSGLDIHFTPNIDIGTLEAIDDKRKARQPTALLLNVKNGTAEIGAYDAPLCSLTSDRFYRPYTPQLRLDIIGKGPTVPALAYLAQMSGFDVSVASPERDTLDAIASPKIRKQAISTAENAVSQSSDPWTAVALLFHDHDWEYPVLDKVLKSDAFYIGALGSRRTQSARIDALSAMGISPDLINRLHAPIGLDIQATTPSEIAISILSEIIKTYRTQTRGPARW